MALNDWFLSQGDFVDRGYNSVETFTMLMLLKARFASLDDLNPSTYSPPAACSRAI